MSGSASQFYIRDDSFRTLRDPSLPPNLNDDKDDHRVHQNALLSSFDLIAAWSNDQFKSKFRFSGTEEHRFNTDDKEIVSVAALFFETTIKQWDLMTRLGRQTRNTGGVLGRFDGGVVSWQASPDVRLNAVAGSPVERRQDEPFKNDRYFYGVSADFGPIWGGLEASVFALEQTGSLLPRSAGRRHRVALHRLEQVGVRDDRLRRPFPAAERRDLQRLLDACRQVDHPGRRRLSQVAVSVCLECTAGTAVPDALRHAAPAYQGGGRSARDRSHADLQVRHGRLFTAR